MTDCNGLQGWQGLIYTITSEDMINIVRWDLVLETQLKFYLLEQWSKVAVPHSSLSPLLCYTFLLYMLNFLYLVQ